MKEKRSCPTRHTANAIGRRSWQPYKVFLLVLPGVLFVILFNYVPLWGWVYSFFSYKPGRALSDCTFVGLDNFTALFGNAVLRTNFLRVIRNTFGIHLISYLFSPLPMIFAIFLSELRSKRFQKISQTLCTLPHFISWVILYSIVFSLFSYNGLINNFLIQIGVKETATNYLISTNNVWITQVLLQQWKNLGWSSIVYFAAIAGIDQALYEAAAIDGAGRLRRIWNITIPQLIPTFFVLLVMSIGKFLSTGVDQYLVFSNAMNKDFIETLDLYVYNLGIGSGQISYSVAVGMMKSIVAVVLFSGANLLSKKVRGESIF